MRVLFILKEFPYPLHRDGLSLINYRLLVALSGSMQISLVCIGNAESENLEGFQSVIKVDELIFVKKTETQFTKMINLFSVLFLGKVLFKNKQLIEALKKMYRKHKYNLIYTAPLVMISELYQIRQSPPIFLNAVDSFSKLNESLYDGGGKFMDKIKFILYQTYERKMLKRAACVNFVSSVDAEYVKDITRHKNIRNIPLGIDLNIFFPIAKIKKESNSIIFTGNFGYRPNFDTGRYIIESVAPLLDKDIKIYIAGKGSHALKELGNDNKNIVITGFVESIAEYLNRSELFFCPLLYGAGMKYKILEAMACGLPVISTSVGISGIKNIVNGYHFILADTLEEQISAIKKALSSNETKKQLANHALEYIKEYPDWDRVVKQYSEIMISCAIT